MKPTIYAFAAWREVEPFEFNIICNPSELSKLSDSRDYLVVTSPKKYVWAVGKITNPVDFVYTKISDYYLVESDTLLTDLEVIDLAYKQHLEVTHDKISKEEFDLECLKRKICKIFSKGGKIDLNTEADGGILAPSCGMNTDFYYIYSTTGDSLIAAKEGDVIHKVIGTTAFALKSVNIVSLIDEDGLWEIRKRSERKLVFQAVNAMKRDHYGFDASIYEEEEEEEQEEGGEEEMEIEEGGEGDQ